MSPACLHLGTLHRAGHGTDIHRTNILQPMPIISVTTFFNGVSTAYFVVSSFLLLRRQSKTRLHTVLGLVSAWWAVMTAKDLLLFFPGHYTVSIHDALQMADGWSVLAFVWLLSEIVCPKWITWRRAGCILFSFASFAGFYAVCPRHAVVTVYIVLVPLFAVWAMAAGAVRVGLYITRSQRDGGLAAHPHRLWMRKIYGAGMVYLSLWISGSVVRMPVTDMLLYLASILLWQYALHYCMKIDSSALSSFGGETDACRDDVLSYPFADRLEELMDRERLYLDPRLSLDQLARRLGTNRTYLSNYLNKVKGMTFYDYIHSLRVYRKSIPLIREHPEYSLDYIAKQSGFNSLSTFQRAFRKHTGTTPGKYLSDQG